MPNIGTTEIVVIAIVILVLFGGKKMNEWAKGLGEAGKEIKNAKKEFETSFNNETSSDGSKQIDEENPKTTEAKNRKGVG